MDRVVLASFFSLVAFAGVAFAQADDFCAEFGATPSFNSPSANVPYVFGRIVLKDHDPGTKFPKITVLLSESRGAPTRLTIERSGNYCFRRISGSGGTLVVDVNGVEVARRTLPSMGPAQQREDFEIYADPRQRSSPPSTISAKFSHPRNDKTIDLYKKAAEAEKNKDLEKTVSFLKEIVLIDQADFIAWAKLGSVYFEQNKLSEADAAFRRSLEAKVDYTPAWIYVGKLRMAQKQYEAAIEIFKHAVELEPTSGRAFQLLGEAHLQARQGTLAVDALDQALKLDPAGMAECHLLKARLYDLAGAKQLAAEEYKAFLAKVPEHPDRKKFEKYIKENPK